MNPVLSLLAFSAVLLVGIECQPLNDARFGFIPYLAEQFSPSLKHHRARFRPFTTQFGSPILNVRAGRSTKEQEQKQIPSAECVYAYESLFCAGINQNGNEVKVECDAKEDFKNTGLGDVTRYALSDLRILKTGGESTITKMYMFGQKENTTSWMHYVVKDQWKNRNILSVHSNDSSNDQGLHILDPKCWENMILFFKSIQVTNEITVENPTELRRPLSEPVKIIAYLNVL